jgi:thioredoxin-like negative regulator of GroEL
MTKFRMTNDEGALHKVDVDQHDKIAQQYGVEVLPAIAVVALAVLDSASG